MNIIYNFKLSFLIVLLLLAGCAARPIPLPEEHSQKLAWGAIDLDINKSGAFTLRDSLGSALLKKANNYHHNESVPYNILTLSGGGTRGAFGAGILSGWQKSGAIPEFDIVTGVSTGAVMAPFVFLGGKELDKVEWFYTKSHTDDVYVSSWMNFLGNAYLMDPTPLRKLFEKTFNETFLNRIAAEHTKGRRLYVGTTNLDTGQFTVWDMGAIASSDWVGKYQRFTDIIYASSAMPIFLPPQYMEVKVDNTEYYQMHVDGGIYSHVFMVGLLVNWEEILELRQDSSDNFDTTLYVIANRKYRNRHMYNAVKQTPSSIIASYIDIETDLLFDRSIYRLYTSSVQQNIKFRMASVPEYANDVDDATEFDPYKMTQLFNIGFQYGINGINWQKTISINEYNTR